MVKKRGSIGNRPRAGGIRLGRAIFTADTTLQYGRFARMGLSPGTEAPMAVWINLPLACWTSFDSEALSTNQRLAWIIFTLHCYPQKAEEFGFGRFDHDATAPANRSTRSLWDTNYVDESLDPEHCNAGFRE